VIDRLKLDVAEKDEEIKRLQSELKEIGLR
jgi:hypothetical protein